MLCNAVKALIHRYSMLNIRNSALIASLFMFNKVYQFLSLRKYLILMSGIIVLLVGIGSLRFFLRTSFVPSLGRPIILGYNQVLRIEEEGLEVKFSGIISDSRCPKSEWVACYWPGQVEALVEVSKNGQDSGDIRLIKPNNHTVSPEIVDIYQLTLLEVEPYPKFVDQVIKPEDYKITIKVQRVDQ